MFILLSFWFFIVLRNFISQITIIDVILMAKYLITGFYINSEGLAITFFSQMQVDIVQWRDEIGAFDNGKKNILLQGTFFLLCALTYAFVCSHFQIFSVVFFTVNLIRFAINARLFLFAITRIFRKVRLQLITLLYSVMIVNIM